MVIDERIEQTMTDKKEINLLIGANIKQARERAGLTQEQLSERMGMGVKSLSAVERGSVGISLTSLKKVCSILHVSSDELIFGDQKLNDISAMCSRLERLTPAQFHIVEDILCKLMEAFTISDQ